MARVTGLEPATSGVTGRRSNQLSYTRNLVLLDRIELSTSPLPRECSTTELQQHGSGGGIRTPGQAVNSRLLYH